MQCFLSGFLTPLRAPMMFSRAFVTHTSAGIRILIAHRNRKWWGVHFIGDQK